LNHEVAPTGAGSAMNAVKLKQQQQQLQSNTNRAPANKPRPISMAPPRYQQIVTSESGQVGFNKNGGNINNISNTNNNNKNGSTKNGNGRDGAYPVEALGEDEEIDELVLKSQSKYLYSNEPDSIDYEILLDERPETSVGKGVDIRGELEFDRLLRIDGTFEGALKSAGSIVVGREGCLIGNVSGMDTLIIDGGRVVGDVQVERLVIRGTGCLTGKLITKSIKLGPHCTIIGSANVHALAPEIIDIHGDIVVDDPDAGHDPFADDDGDAVYAEDEDLAFEALNEEDDAEFDKQGPVGETVEEREQRRNEYKHRHKHRKHKKRHRHRKHGEGEDEGGESDGESDKDGEGIEEGATGAPERDDEGSAVADADAEIANPEAPSEAEAPTDAPADADAEIADPEAPSEAEAPTDAPADADAEIADPEAPSEAEAPTDAPADALKEPAAEAAAEPAVEAPATEPAAEPAAEAPASTGADGGDA